MSTPIDYKVGEKVLVTKKSLDRINTKNRCTGVSWYSDEFKATLLTYAGQVATVQRRFPPGFEMNIVFDDGKVFQVKDNWVEPVNCYDVTLTFSGQKKTFRVQALTVDEAIAATMAKQGGRHWLTCETAESQARH